MPPQDHHGNLLLKPTRYLKLIVAIWTLLGLVVGGASVFWAMGVNRGEELSAQKQQRETMADVVKTVNGLAETARTQDKRISRLEWDSGRAGG